MQLLMSTIEQGIAGYIWPLFRISSMLMVMAIFGAGTTPARVRLLLAVTITVAVAPMLPQMPAVELFSLKSFFITAQQVMIGTAMGFISQMLLQTFVLTGQIIGMQTSLGFASMVDPGSGQQVPAVGNFFLILSTFIFLSVDGHLVMIQMIIASFETIPVSSTGINIANYQAAANWGSYMFGAALTMSISAILALLLINLSFGVMTRAAPQLNIFSIGFPITMLSGLLILWFTLTPIMSHFGDVWKASQILMCDMLELQCNLKSKPCTWRPLKVAESDGQERSEAPTSRRLQQARDKGQVARSKELGTSAVLLSAAIALAMLGPDLAQSLFRVMTDVLTIERSEIFDTGSMLRVFGVVAKELAWPVFGIVIVITIVAFLGNIVIGGMSFSSKAIMPKGSKMNPFKGFKRMFGIQAVVELTKGIAKFSVIAISAFLLLKFYFYDILGLSSFSFTQ